MATDDAAQVLGLRHQGHLPEPKRGDVTVERQRRRPRLGGTHEGLEATQIATMNRGAGDGGSAAQEADHPVLRRRGWIVAGSLAVLMLVAALAVPLLVDRGGAPELVRPEVTYTTGPSRIGQPATLGDLFLEYPQHADIEIVSVEPNLSGNVEVIDTLAVFPVPEGYGGGVDGAHFPLQDPDQPVDYRPAVGEIFRASEVGPGQDAGVIALHLGVRATSGELGGLNGVRVRYRVDGETRSHDFPHALVLCLQPDGCAVDDDEALRSLGLLPGGPSE